MTSGIKIDIEAKNNGVFLIVQGKTDNKNILKEMILKKTRELKLTDIDMEAIESALNSNSPISRTKISDNLDPFAKDESVSLEVSHNSMEAYLEVFPPVFGGKLMSNKDLEKFLDDKGIVFGVDRDVSHQIISEREYGRRYVIAKGDQPSVGENGYIKYFFDTNKKVLKPVILENGTVDYKNLNNIDTAVEGQVLCAVVEATDGNIGRDIYGREIKGIKGKLAPKLLAGNGVIISEDKKELVANINGQILFANKRVSISKILYINESVGPATGNINFGGSIIITGNVQSDFEIIAGGNVEITGMVEGDKIIAGGNISIAGGVQGKKNTVLNATGNITAKFISNATVFAVGDIYADSLVRCTTKCRGSIELRGVNGALTSGTTYVKEEFTANTIGSPLSANTSLCVGLDPVIYSQYLTMKHELNELEKEYEGHLKDLSTFEKTPYMELPKERQSKYIVLSHSTKILSQNIVKFKIKLAKVLELLNERKNCGSINLKMVMHAGVKLQVGNAVIYVKDKIPHCRIINVNDEMKVLRKNKQY